jgi:hypothetical protein
LRHLGALIKLYRLTEPKGFVDAKLTVSRNYIPQVLGNVLPSDFSSLFFGFDINRKSLYYTHSL